MNKITPSAAVLLFLLLTANASASDLVRVEVLIFTHQSGQSDRWPVAELPDFSPLIDPRTRAEAKAWPEQGLQVDAWANRPEDPDPGEDPEIEALARPGAEAPGLPGAPPGLLRHPGAGGASAEPEPFVHDEALSTTMQRALTRLRGSAVHEVVSLTSWLQPLSRRARSPAVRVRDDTPLDMDSSPSPPRSDFLADALFAPTRQLPAHYRLDGSVRLRQRQFRHVDLDLVWSEPLPSARLGPTLQEASFEIHRLQQSRPIQLGRLEYFDSAWLGVLVLVTPWEPSATPTDG